MCYNVQYTPLTVIFCIFIVLNLHQIPLNLTNHWKEMAGAVCIQDVDTSGFATHENITFEAFKVKYDMI